MGQNCFNLCYPFEFYFLVDVNVYDLQICPTILFEISSLDSWNVFRIEGYGNTKLISRTGCRTIKIDTWRPKGNFLEELRRYFIGTGISIRDKKFLEENSKGFTNRCNWTGQSSGSLELRSHTIVVDPHKLKREKINQSEINRFLNLKK